MLYRGVLDPIFSCHWKAQDLTLVFVESSSLFISPAIVCSVWSIGIETKVGILITLVAGILFMLQIAFLLYHDPAIMHSNLKKIKRLYDIYRGCSIIVYDLSIGKHIGGI